ncbi:MAG TPA: hypothetical protein DDW81_02895, partial [Cryomorphaceae bacterium]|nr:hypothetical protein [Cryomorphaceae bacterium]
MNRILVVLLTLTSCVGRAQTDFNSDIEFTADLENFGNLSGWKESLEGVDIIALGENTHGLGEVFAAKAELVSFLHQELGFDLLLFESGYGDAALAWERLDVLSPREFTRIFSSNFYYHSEEIEELVSYVKAQNGGLKIQGFDCQPQQNYLVKRMTEIAQAIDSAWARSVVGEMNSFNKLYQLENDRDTLGFNQQRDRFVDFLHNYNAFLNENTDRLLASGATENEIKALKRSNEIFLNTYAKVTIGEMMGWP